MGGRCKCSRVIIYAYLLRIPKRLTAELICQHGEVRAEVELRTLVRAEGLDAVEGHVYHVGVVVF